VSAEARDPRERLAEFAGYLREHGFALGYAEIELMTRAAADVALSAWPHIEARWRAIASGNRPQWLKYSELHRAFWFPDRVQGTVRSSGVSRRRRTIPELIEQRRAESGNEPPRFAPGSQSTSLGATQDLVDDDRSTTAQGGASRTEALEQRDFTDWTAEDIERFELLVEQFQRRLRTQLLRRWQKGKTDGAIDLRQTLRTAMGTAGELIQLQHLRRRREPPRVVLFVDVSRSMEVHAQFYLRLARAFVDVMDARAFVFHTRLADVTALMQRGGRRVQEKINAVTFGFGGGTRIASCLQDALHHHLSRTLRRGDVMFIFSDGYDTDEPGALAQVLAQIRARGTRIVWLHPTMQVPESAAMAMARNLVTRFLPAHNLASLSRLPQVLG
jgi:uncharacterized protein with von Willebrand factor type A (vWA) domain